MILGLLVARVTHGGIFYPSLFRDYVPPTVRVGPPSSKGWQK